MSFIENLMELGVREKVDRLYLEKCQEVNKLERKLDGQKALLEERNKELTACKDELRKLKEAQDGDLISRTEALKAVEAAHSRIFAFTGTLDVKTMNEIMSQYGAVKDRALELIGEIPAVSGRSAVEQLYEDIDKQWKCWQKTWGVAEMPEQGGTVTQAEMAAEPLKEYVPVTAQEILCLSSALRNLYEIHKCDGWLLYNRLSKVLEKAVEEYSRELGANE